MSSEDGVLRRNSEFNGDDSLVLMVFHQGSIKEARAKQPAKELRHLRGGDVEDEVVRGDGELLGHHPLPYEAVGGHVGVGEAMLVQSLKSVRIPRLTIVGNDPTNKLR